MLKNTIKLVLLLNAFSIVFLDIISLVNSSIIFSYSSPSSFINFIKFSNDFINIKTISYMIAVIL